LTLLIGVLGGTQPASASIARWLGWKYSDNKKYKAVEHWIIEHGTQIEILGTVAQLGGAPPIVGAVTRSLPTLLRVVDPVPGSIISGRVTFAFDPDEIVTAAGWYGEFGADPNLPAPPIDADPDLALLQTEANPAMLSRGIFIDQTLGRAVFEFNWGPEGFVPTRNMDAEGHFNILGLYLVQPNDLSASTSEMVGSLADVLANGTNASTYMMCNSPTGGGEIGSCGLAEIPEPSTWPLVAAGLLALVVKRGFSAGHREHSYAREAIFR
jgi:hypothetical protein